MLGIFINQNLRNAMTVLFTVKQAQSKPWPRISVKPAGTLEFLVSNKVIIFH